MTMEELLKTAQDGDVSAMLELGEHYHKNREEFDACEWFECAAETGNCHGISMAMVLNPALAQVLQEMSLWDRALSHWHKANHWAGIILSNAEAFGEEIWDIAHNTYVDSFYRMGFCVYRMQDYDEAIRILNLGIKHGDKRCEFLSGLCMLDKSGEDFVAGAKQAYAQLKVIEETDLEIAEDLIFRGLMQLGIVYRTFVADEIPGISKDIERSYRCVLRATKLSGKLGDAARAELAKYRQKLFGGYTYNG